LDLGLTFKNSRTFLPKTALYRSSPPRIAITHPTSTSVSPTIKSFPSTKQNENTQSSSKVFQHFLRQFQRNIPSPLSSFYSAEYPCPMQSLDCKVFCRICKELTYREVRYRSDFQFVGRLLVCQNCGETILEPVGSGTVCQDC
jgi:hypothetical protein